MSKAGLQEGLVPPGASPSAALRVSSEGPRVRGYRASQLARRVRAMVARAQGDICAICGGHMERNAQLAASRDEAVTLDHAIPLKRGGPDALGNLIAAHNACNARKGDRMPNGCELIWLLSVNARLGHGPVRW